MKVKMNKFALVKYYFKIHDVTEINDNLKKQ